MTEESLIQELKKGNAEVLKEVYVNLKMVSSFVTQNSGTVEDAQDLFQEAVIVFHRNVIREEFQLSSTVGTYLYSICKRMWFNKLKREKRKDNGLNEYVVESIIEAFDFEIRTSSDVDASKKINLILDEIGAKCKTILDLFYFQKASQEVICEKLGYSSSQVVRQQKYRCLKKIKEKLGVMGDTINPIK